VHFYLAFHHADKMAGTLAQQFSELKFIFKSTRPNTARFYCANNALEFQHGSWSWPRALTAGRSARLLALSVILPRFSFRPYGHPCFATAITGLSECPLQLSVSFRRARGAP